MDEEVLAAELADLERDGLDLKLVGFSDEELEALLASDSDNSEPEEEEPLVEPPSQPITRLRDVWLIGPHHLICGDCRDLGVIEKLLDGKRANVVITSPPYATQREYDPTSGFKPVRPDEYSDWYRDVAVNIQAILAPDGSYFLNIKEHAEDGERSLYVKDLLLAHKRQCKHQSRLRDSLSAGMQVNLARSHTRRRVSFHQQECHEETGRTARSCPAKRYSRRIRRHEHRNMQRWR
jgi:hypothetical protein